MIELFIFNGSKQRKIYKNKKDMKQCVKKWKPKGNKNYMWMKRVIKGKKKTSTLKKKQIINKLIVLFCSFVAN